MEPFIFILFLLLQDRTTGGSIMSVNMPSLPRLPSKAKFWKKKSSSAKLTEVDPSYRAIYLGNVLTGWAKGKAETRLLSNRWVSK